MEYTNFFGFNQKPFPQDLRPQDLLVSEQLKAWQARFDFVTSHKLWAVLTGEVGAGKSTAIRWTLESLPHPEFKILLVTAGTGSILEIYRRILDSLGLPMLAGRAKMFAAIKQGFKDIAIQNVTPLLVIDEASLMSIEVFRELHTLTQFHCDSKALLSVILVGQDDLIDKLSYPTSRPLASRITARMHFVAGDEMQTANYLAHHIKLAGGRKNLFEEAAVAALHQASGGIPRNINNIARCALITAAANKRQIVNVDDIRIASTELFSLH